MNQIASAGQIRHNKGKELLSSMIRTKSKKSDRNANLPKLDAQNPPGSGLYESKLASQAPSSRFEHMRFSKNTDRTRMQQTSSRAQNSSALQATSNRSQRISLDGALKDVLSKSPSQSVHQQFSFGKAGESVVANDANASMQTQFKSHLVFP